MIKYLLANILLLLLLTNLSQAQDKKVAIVTFYAVKQVGVPGSRSDITSNKLSDAPAFNLAAVLKDFHDQFFETYSTSFPFQFLPEDQVVNNKDYKDFIPDNYADIKSLDNIANIPARGYKVILPLKSYSNEKNLLKIFDQCDGVMEIYINFDLLVKGLGGVGIIKANAHATIILFNKNGDKVFTVTEEALSKISGALIVGIPSFTPEKMLPLCKSAAEELVPALQKDLPKMIKKAKSKL